MADRACILVVAGLHSFLGEVDNRGMRVLDVLNGVGSGFIHLNNVAVFRGFNGECLEQIKEAAVPKSTIDFVLIESSAHEAPMRRMHSYVEKTPKTALVLLGDYEIRGTFMQRGSSDGLQVLGRDASDFFPITGACVHRLGHASESVKVGVALVNHARVTLLHLEQQPAMS
jgi:hypothetical protein